MTNALLNGRLPHCHQFEISFSKAFIPYFLEARGWQYKPEDGYNGQDWLHPDGYGMYNTDWALWNELRSQIDLLTQQPKALLTKG